MTRSPLLSRAATVAAALLLVLSAVSAFGQFQTGNIYGNVQAKDGSILPGVTVTLTGIGAPQVFVTDATGDFRFLNLSPGTYQTKAELVGFGTAIRQNIPVSVGKNTEITIKMTPSVESSITVTAEAPLIDTRKTGTGAVVSRVELEQIPTGRDPWVIMGQAPGVQLDRVNVAGSESGQQDVVVAKGAGDTQKTFNLDGVNITDVGAIGSTPIYYDFDSFEEIQVTTGGSDPRIQTPGAQLNMVTKRGTNDFKGAGRYILTKHSWQASAAAPSEAASYLAQGNTINNIANWSGDVGGPILKDRLWIWGSYARQDIKLFTADPIDQTTGLPAPLTKDNTLLKDWNGKLNFQPLSNNSGTYLYTYGDKIKIGRYADPTHPQETTEDQTGPTHMYKLEDTHIFSQNLYMTLLYSHVFSPFQFVPEGGNVQPFIDGDGVWHRSFFYYETNRPQNSYRGDGSYFFKTGTLDHELKFGYGYRRAPVTSLSTYPATGVLGDFSQGFASKDRKVPDNIHGVALLTRPGANNYKVGYSDYYVGDTITTGNLTVQGGLRFDRQKGKNGANAITANPLAPDILAAVTVPADPRELHWNSVSPRLGFTYTINGTHKTLVRGSYNRYVDQLGGDVVSAGNPYNYAAGLYYRWNDANGDKTVQRSELDFGAGYYNYYGNIDPQHPNDIPHNARLDYGMKPPKTDEFIAGFETQVMADLSVGVDYTYRKFSDFWWNVHEKADGSIVGPSDYTCATITTLATPDGQMHPVVNCTLQADTVGTVVTNRPGYNQTYNGLDLFATKRMSHNWMLRGSFSYNDRKQHVRSSGIEDPTQWLQPPSPITNNYYGCTSCDGSIVVDRSYGTHSDTYVNAKWQYNLTSLYQFPWQISVGANLTGRQGYPIPYYVRAGSKRILLDGIDGGREPDQMELDLRVAKDIALAKATSVTLALEAFNVTNNRPVLQRQPRLYTRVVDPDTGDVSYPAFGTQNNITEVQVPRVFRVSAKMSF